MDTTGDELGLVELYIAANPRSYKNTDVLKQIFVKIIKKIIKVNKINGRRISIIAKRGESRYNID